MSRHKVISLVKSGVRLAGYMMLMFASEGIIRAAAYVLVVSEVLGVFEEVGEV